jgi:hypothetical protein
MTAEKIVIKWLIGEANSSDPWFYTYDFETRVPMYGRLAHGKTHTASTYSRVFRKIRENNVLKKYGLILEEVKHNNNEKVKGWKVVKDS